MESKNNNKVVIFTLIIIVLILLLVVLVKFTITDDSSTNMNNKTNMESLGENSEVEAITTNVTSTDKRGEESYSDFNAKIDLNTLTVEGSHVNISGTTITINNKGNYYFTGTAEEANIVVNANDSDDVVLVFDNVNITSSKTACINGVNAKNIYINLVEGTTNTFTDGEEYTIFIEDDEPDACIFSKTDLLINGKGSLVVNANYNDGITSKDDLVITNSNIVVKSKYNGIKGKDSLDILDAKIVVEAGNDGIKATNEEDTAKGYLIIKDSDISLDVIDDGIHAETDLIIDGGKIEIIESKEGIEGKLIVINNGEIEVYSDDDGINATDGNGTQQMGRGTEGVELQINGGTIYVNADGDGLDSNGSILITGGNIIVAGSTNGGNGAIDSDGGCKIIGGKLLVYGATGMWENPINSSTQNTIAFSVNGKSGDFVEIKNSNGDTIVSFNIDKDYGAILYSDENIEKDETYTIYVNNEEKSSIEVTETINSEISGGNMQGGMQRGNRQNMKEIVEMPNN